ncbi:MAG: cytochrome c [Gemmatimonadaceae bacterium]
MTSWRRRYTGLTRTRCAWLLVVGMIACRPEAPSARLPNPPAPTPSVLAEGDTLFRTKCARCHGTWALGTDSGPPLLHAIYAPAHHADAAFLLAVRLGVRAHHWTYGDMPPVAGVTTEQAIQITAYIRWLQSEAGIH